MVEKAVGEDSNNQKADDKNVYEKNQPERSCSSFNIGVWKQ